MSQSTSPQHLQMCIRNSLGWHPSTLQEKQQWPPCQPHQNSSLYRLATTGWVYQHHPRLQTRVLQLRKNHAWCSNMSSSTGSLTLRSHTNLTIGRSTSKSTLCSNNIRIFPTTSRKVLTSAFPPLSQPSRHPTDLLSPNSHMSMTTISASSLNVGDTLVPQHRRKLRPLLDRSKLPLSPLYPSQENLENLDSYKTSRIPSLLQTASHLSTAALTPTTTPADGAHSQSSASWSPVCPQVPKQWYEMSKRPTVPYQSSHLNGQDWLLGSKVKTDLQSTQGIASDSL